MAITVKLSAQSVSCGFAVCNKIVASAPANFMLYLEKLARRPENTNTFSLENAFKSHREAAIKPLYMY